MNHYVENKIETWLSMMIIYLCWSDIITFQHTNDKEVAALVGLADLTRNLLHSRIDLFGVQANAINLRVERHHVLG